MIYGSKGNSKAIILDKEELKFFWNLIVVSLIIQNNFNKYDIKAILINQMNFFVLYFSHLRFSINSDVSYHLEGFSFHWSFGLIYFH